MIDYSVPYHGLLMKRARRKPYAAWPLPDGFSFCTYHDGMKKDWVEIHTVAQMVSSREEAEKVFDEKIMPFAELLSEFCIFISDPQGKCVANASLLPGFHFGEKHWQVYWVAVVPAYEGRHLCHALIAHLLDLFYERIGEDWLYLATQTWNYCAISVYKDMGFVPYIGENPVNWQSDDFELSNVLGWKIVDEQIGKHVKERVLGACDRCRVHTENGELCFPAFLCNITKVDSDQAKLTFLRRAKYDSSLDMWDASKLVVIRWNGKHFAVTDAHGDTYRLTKIEWYNIITQLPVCLPVSRQSFFVRMMGISGLLLRGRFPIIRHGILYGQTPFADNEELIQKRANMCRLLYELLNPCEVTGPYAE